MHHVDTQKLIIRPIDIDSDDDLQNLIDLSSAVSIKLYGHPSHITVEEQRANLKPTPYDEIYRWVAEYEGILMGQVTAQLPLQDDSDFVYVSLLLHPEYEAGEVAQLLAHHAYTRAIVPSGRKHINYFANIMPYESLDDPSLAANRVAAVLGVSPKNDAVTRIAPLPLAPALVEMVSSKVEALSDLHLEVWENHFPKEHLDSIARAFYQLELDEPVGEAEKEPTQFTADQVAALEKRIHDSGERFLAAVVLDGSEVAAISLVEYSEHLTNISAWQSSTVVMPDFRGRGVSRLLKFTLYSKLPELAPNLQQIITMNSAVNPAMIKVNEELGYRPVWEEICYQN